jgi:DNA polymerase-3 subunit delta'
MVFPWLETFWQHLVSYKIKQRIPSGLMLSGLPGIGKTSFALSYAQYILCQQSTEQCCGQCRSCILFKAGNHPDFSLIEPTEVGGIIKIDQIRNLVEDVAQTSNLSDYQVVIINKAEDLNRSAANALLKNLEEPSGRVLFLLLSEQPQTVTATIRSRCQILQFPHPTKSQALAYLKEQYPEQKNCERLLTMANNLPLKAMDFVQLSDLRDNLLVLLERMSRGELEPVSLTKDYFSQTKEVIELLITLVIDMIRIQFSSQDNLNHADKISELQRLNKSKTLVQLYQFLSELFDALRMLRNKNNLNLQLLLENIFIGWCAA